MQNREHTDGLTDEGVDRERLQISSVAELRAHEIEILDRIHREPDGDCLFFLNPFRLLSEIGVDITTDFRAQLLRNRPHLGALSLMAYEAVRQASSRQPVSAHIRRLFRREDR